MVFKVVPFGDLKGKVKEWNEEYNDVDVLELDEKKFKKISSIVEELSLKREELSHIFLNHSYRGEK